MSECHVTVFGVQPLAFTAEANANLLAAQLAGNDGSPPQAVPAWVAELEGLYPNRHFRYRRVEPREVVAAADRRHALSTWLCSNTVLNQHVVVFELDAGVCDHSDVDVGELRSTLVAAANDGRPDAVKAALLEACVLVARDTGCRPGDVGVLDNSCNVTVFLRPTASAATPESNMLLSAEETEVFAHDGAERLTVARSMIRVSAVTRVFFGGRAHVVVSDSDSDIGVIRQIMLMLQLMWFYVPLYLRHASALHRQLHGDRSRLDLDNLEASASDLVYVYQTVRLQNESQKISWEALTQLVYRPAEALWAVESSIDQLQRYAEFFQAFIKDVREVQSRRADEILNYVLAALALFGLVGLWANILGTEASVRDIVSFRNLIHTATDSALGFTTIGFLVVSAFVAGWLILFGIRARHGRRRRRAGRHRAPK